MGHSYSLFGGALPKGLTLVSSGTGVQLLNLLTATLPTLPTLPTKPYQLTTFISTLTSTTSLIHKTDALYPEHQLTDSKNGVGGYYDNVHHPPYHSSSSSY